MDSGPGNADAKRDDYKEKSLIRASSPIAGPTEDLLRNVPVGMYRSSPDGRLVWANQALADLLGFESLEALLARPTTELYEASEAREVWKNALEERGQLSNYEMRHRQPDGTWIWVRDTASVVLDEAGEVLCYDGILQDVTREVEARQALQHAARLITMGESLAHVGSWELDLTTQAHSWSEELFEILGLRSGYVTPSFETLADRIHPDDRDRVMGEMEQGMTQSEPATLEWRIVRPDGEVRWVRAESHAQQDGAGHAVKVYGIMLDVTELKAAEDGLRESEQRHRRVSELASDFGYCVRIDKLGEQQLEWITGAFSRITGLSEEAAKEIGLFTLLHPDDATSSPGQLARVLEGEDLESLTSVELPNGEIHWLLSRSKAEPGMTSGEHLIYGAVRDITKWKQAEIALQRSEARLAEAQQVAHVGSWDLDATIDTLVWSEEHHRLFDVDPAEFGGDLASGMARIHPDDRERVEELFQQSATTGTPLSCDLRVLHRDGTIRHIHSDGRAILDDGGRLVRMFGTAHDITERVEAEELTQISATRRAAISTVRGGALSGELHASLCELACEQVAKTLEVELVGVMELEPNGRLLSMSGGYGWELDQLRHVSVPADARSSLSGFTMDVDSPVVVENFATESRFEFHPMLAERGVTSAASVPIKAAGRTYGALSAHGRSRKTFSPDDLSFLQTVANVLAEATRRDEADSALRASERRFRGLFEQVPVGVFRSRPDGTMLDANPALATALGYPDRAGLLAADARLHYADPTERARWVEALEREGIVRNFEQQLRRTNGTLIWMRSTTQAIRGEDGSVDYYEGVIEDVTEAKQAHEALRESEARARSIVEATLDCIVMMDHQGLIIEFNPAAERTFGYRRDEILGEPVSRLMPEDLRARHEAGLKRYLETGESQVLGKRLEMPAIRKDGSGFTAEYSIVSVEGADPPRFTGYLRELTTD